MFGLWKSRQPVTSAPPAQPNPAPNPIPPRPVMAVAAAAVAFGLGMGSAFASPPPIATIGSGTWPVSDAFAGTGGTVLSAHTPDSGGTWTLHPSYSGTAVLDAANRLRQATTAASCYYANVPPTSENYDVTANVNRLSNAAFPSTAGVVGRLDTSTDTCYTARQEIQGSNWALYKRVAGTETSLGTSSVPSITTGTPNTMTLRMVGSSIKVLVDGVVRISATDSSITNTGRAGVRFTSVTASPTDTTLIHLEDFAAEDVPVDPRVILPVIAQAEPPRPFAGSIVATTARPAATPQFDQPPRASVASTEPPRPYPGWSFDTSAIPVTIGRFDEPAPSITARSESPPPYPGSAVDTSAIPAIVATFDRPSGVTVARAEPPTPDAGSAIFRGSRPGVEDVPVHGLMARSEPPTPFAGSVLATTARPASVTPFDWPADTVMAHAEPPPPYAGWSLCYEPPKDTGAGPGPEADPLIPRRAVIARKHAPIVATVRQSLLVAGAIPQQQTAVPVTAAAESPAPFAGSVVATSARPLAVAPFDPPARGAAARSEPPRPDAGSVVTATVRYIVTSGDLAAEATIARSEPPAPFAGSVVATTARPLAIVPAARPVAITARSEPPRPYPGSVQTWIAAPPTFEVPTPAAVAKLVLAEPQPSYPGSVSVSTVRRISVAQVATPRRSFVVRSEPPRPFPGHATSRGLSRGPSDFTLAGIQYRIYANTGSGDPIDYTLAVNSTFGLTWTSGPLGFPCDWKFGVRAYDVATMLEERNVDAVVRLLTDATGADITAMPDPPTGLSGVPRASGDIRLDWSYALADRDRPPTYFHVYRGTGGVPDYTTPVATVQYFLAVLHFSATVSGGSDGIAYTFGVRAYNATGEEVNVLTTTVTADATGPAAVSGLSGSSTT